VVPIFTNEEIDKTAQSGGLLTMEVEFNSECSYRCVYCYADNGPTKNAMTREEWKVVIGDARKLGARTIVVLGGEPMLYPHLFEMVEFMRGIGLDVEVFTNGTNMTPKAARRFRELGVTVVLKMNSLDPERQDALAGKPGAHLTIRSALDILTGVGYPGADKKLGASTIICNQNYDELEKLWVWLRDRGIAPYFETLTPQGRASGNESLVVDSVRLRDLFSHLAEIDRKYGFDWTPQPPLVGSECLRHRYSCVVKPDGRVTPCVGVDIVVGNVREKGLARVIRESEVVGRLRNYRENIKGPCAKCERLSRCYGCRGAAYQMTGDYLASDPMCWMLGEEPPTEVLLPADAARLMPHRKPMLMVDRLVSVGEETTVSAHLGPDMIFMGSDGMLDDTAFLELMAQAMAAHQGFDKRDNGGANGGYLVGARNLKVFGTAKSGDDLTIVVRRVLQIGKDLAVINGRVMNGAEKLAEGELTIWQESEKSAK
jgi:radical SAM protein with 4Fe4S-binding SPASM domain